jgi:hypothetical protein
MRVKRVSFVLVLFIASIVSAYDNVLAEGILDKSEKYASWSAFYKQLHSLDVDIDYNWLKADSIQKFDILRREQREKMTKRIGGFPERTPLNAKVIGIIQREGYRVEKIIFESRPGMFVTANLYLPDESRFPAPYPASIEVCGHSKAGKNAPKYQRVALLCAKNGVAVLVIDPIGQGERCQSSEEEPSQEGTPVKNHLRMGVNTILLGRGLAAFEIWDAMRALDYLDTRSDIRKDGYGSLGNSGGGTQSIMLAALDDRIKATATCCYLSNFRDQTMWRLLADSEQLIFSQLSDGFNHASYPLLSGNPVLMLARRNDMIPFSGTLDTARLLSEVGGNLGRKGYYSIIDAPGPHGYNEKLMRATSTFMAFKMRGENAVFDEPEFDATKQDFGPDATELWCVPDGRVMSMKGFKSVYSYLQDELDGVLSARVNRSKESTAKMVRTIADIDERRVRQRTVLSESQLTNGTRVIRTFYEVSDGYKMPVVEIIPLGSEQFSPIVIAADGGKTNSAELVKANVGKALFVADLCACGETGAPRHHYVCRYDDEETAKMLYLLGSSLVGRRAGELIALGKEALRRFGKNPAVITTGRLAVPAAHAIAAEPGLFARHEFVDPPTSWETSVRTRAMSLYSTAVHGGLLHYDWVDLTK